MVAVQLKSQAPDVGTRVFFHQLAVLNQGASEKAGRPIYDDIEHCMVTFAGNKYTIGDFPALDYADWVTDDLTGVRRQRTYAEKWNAEYLAFKRGDDQAGSGTPLEELPFLSQGKRLELKALHIHTAESLAGLDGNNLKMLGMGGRELKDKAQAYLDTAAKVADTSHLQAELATRDAQIAEMQAQIQALMAGTPPAATIVPSIVTEPDETAQAFETYQDDDLAAWLSDAGVTVDGRWGRARMLTEAKAVLDKTGKKKAA